MKHRKLTREKFLSLLCNNEDERAQLLLSPIHPYTINDVFEKKAGSKTVFKLNPSKSQYQTKLIDGYFSKIELNQSAVAYVKNKSYLHLFEPHRNNYHFLRLDIKSFFHSIGRKLVKESLSSYISDEDFYKDSTDSSKNQKLIDAVLNIFMLNLQDKYKDIGLLNREILPIGFKSSPSISNLIFRKFDYIIQNECAKNNIVYTRYADDMIFSSSKKHKYLHSQRFIDEISYILNLGDFSLNRSKTVKDRNMISVNGYVIENKSDQEGYIRLSNKKTVTISKLLNKIEKGETPEQIMKKMFGLRRKDIPVRYSRGKSDFISQYYKSQLENVLAGYRAYLISIINFNLNYNCLEYRYVLKYQKLIDRLQKQLITLM